MLNNLEQSKLGIYVLFFLNFFLQCFKFLLMNPDVEFALLQIITDG